MNFWWKFREVVFVRFLFLSMFDCDKKHGTVALQVSLDPMLRAQWDGFGRRKIRAIYFTYFGFTTVHII